MAMKARSSPLFSLLMAVLADDIAKLETSVQHASALIRVYTAENAGTEWYCEEESQELATKSKLSLSPSLIYIYIYNIYTYIVSLRSAWHGRRATFLACLSPSQTYRQTARNWLVSENVLRRKRASYKTGKASSLLLILLCRR